MKGTPRGYSNLNDAKLTPQQAKATILELLEKGFTIADACKVAGRSVKSYEGYKANDSEFRKQVEVIRAVAQRKGQILPEDESISFEDFRLKYLNSKTFPHQLNMVDLLEDREPRWLHPSMVYEPGEPQYVLINVPPDHCARVDTPVFSNRGWITVGDVQIGDRLVSREGIFAPVYDVWEPEGEVETFKITFNTGDEIVTDAGHKWILHDYAGNQTMLTTGELLERPRINKSQKWRVKVTPAVMPDAPVELPLDPYIMGYWLGDGDKNAPRLAVGDEDTASILSQLDAIGLTYKVSRDSRLGSNVVYIHGIRKYLPMQDKRIPEEYMLGSVEQRMALLQGLMDSDGTINPKDGRAKWTQANRDELTRDVYRLIASLGYQPRWRKYAASKGSGLVRSGDYGISNEVYFRPDERPVFRLERKIAKQKPMASETKTAYRVINSITPMGLGRVKCITVTGSDSLFALGDAMILTHNAKSMTVSIDYVTYRICLDPTIRIKIVSKTQTMAAEFLYAVKQRLSSPMWAELQKRFAPVEGYKATSDKWTNTEIYLARESSEKDPTVQALGIGGHIYGARADLIILDDCVVLSNAGEYEKQMRWIQQDCVTRLGPSGKLLVVGTRVDPIDLYKELRNDSRYPEGESPWTYLAMPAVLEIFEDTTKWVTLWPKSDVPWKKDKTDPDENGLYPRWDGPHLRKRRAVVEAHTWAMVYQQQDVSSEAIFLKEAVQGSIDGMRASGPLVKNAPGHPNLETEPYVICAMDPAMSGDTFTIAYAGDHKTQERYVLECSKMTAPTPAKIREIIFSWTDKYRPKVWVIEKNAFQLFLTQDEQINQFLATRGIRLVQHYTGNNKMDIEFGVASVSPLFGHVDSLGRHMGDNLIHLPRSDNESVKALIEQLVTWSPGTRNKSDGPMSLWFAETQMRQFLTQTGIYQTTVVRNPFTTRQQASQRRSVNLDEWEEYQKEIAMSGRTW